MGIIKVTAEAEQWGNRGSLSCLLFVCWALRRMCAPLSAQTHSSTTCQQGKAMAVGLESWCTRNDWKTRACLVLKGENLRGPYCCPTLHGWHEKGAEISVGCGQWVDFTGKQKGAQRKGFSCWELLHLVGHPERGLQADSGWKSESGQKLWEGFLSDHWSGGWIKRSPRSLPTLRFFTTHLTSVIHFCFWLTREARAVGCGCLSYLLL